MQLKSHLKLVQKTQTIIEYEEKLRETARELKEFKEGDKKAREDAMVAFRKGDFSKARELLEKQRKKEKQRDKEEAKTSYLLGNVYFLQHKSKEALASYLEAEQLDPQNWVYLNSIGIFYLNILDFQKAEVYFKKSLELAKTNGEADSRTATSWNNLGTTFHDRGRFDLAIQYYQKALDIDIKVHGESHPNVAKYWNNLGTVYRDQGLNDRAIQYFQKSEDVFIKVQGKKYPHIATVWSHQGDVFIEKKQYDRAIQYYQKALNIDIKVFGESHPKVAIDWIYLGVAYLYKKKYKKASMNLEKALLVFEKFLGTDHPYTRDTRLWLKDAKEELAAVE